MQVCGDAHLANFGGFAAPDRDLVFDINDFDETNPGPFEWDVKRLAASFEIAARSRELSPKTARSLVLAAVSTYREAMAQFAELTNLGVWYSRLDVNTLLERFRGELTGEELKRFERTVAKARGKDSVKALGKLAQLVDGEYRIVSDPPVVVPLSDLFPARRGGRNSAGGSRTGSACTGAASKGTDGTCSRATGSSTSPARWSASAVWAPAAGSRS